MLIAIKNYKIKNWNFMKELQKHFDHNFLEKKIYENWERSGYFNPDTQPNVKKGNKTFTIIMPPPNANEALHLGHALTITIEDIMIRFHRMQGEKTLWLPGSDHAGFETQVVFEKKLEKKGQSRFDFDRDTLYKMIWEYVQSNKNMMESQVRALGASCDWSREKFTLDPRIIKIVHETFKKLYDDGLVYRGKRVINWCPKHQTSFSELEVKYQEREDKLWYIKYPLSSGKEFIVVATTRPETMLGDTAVAVNPKDKRYKKLVGQKVKLPLTNREIPIVADRAVELDFGTGAVKITPAHDQTDFEIAERHNLEILEVIGKNGKMTDLVPEEYRGLKTIEARERIVAALAAQGLLKKEEAYKHTVGTCYKCGRTIEPMVSEQWFIKIKSLAENAAKAVKSGQTKFITKKYEKIFFHWMKILRDWNISRQIVWGIQIPAWYCEKCHNVIVTAGEKPAKCLRCGSQKLEQEKDVFDTWFSSAQWPFATLMTGQPNDFKTFYPTTVMETGWDILPFWVARMLMLGIYRTTKVPFKYVYLHGMIRDKERQKMSKSKGNVIDPLGVVELYGTDAVRMALVFAQTTGNDTILSEEKIRGMRNFVTKIWNASKFVISQLEGFKETKKYKYRKEDILALNKLKKIIKEIDNDYSNFKFGRAAEKLYKFFWHEFCDKILENCKNRIYQSKSKEDKLAAQKVLLEILEKSLKLLHPIMPFVTEEIYQHLPLANSQKRASKSIMVSDWPEL